MCLVLLSGGFGGGRTLTIYGSGFGDEETTTVTMCGNECVILNIEPGQIQCDVPTMTSKTMVFTITTIFI